MSFLIFLPFYLGALTMLLYMSGYKINYSILKLTGVVYMLNVKAPTTVEDYYD
jgi:hypothetical protein